MGKRWLLLFILMFLTIAIIGCSDKREVQDTDQHEKDAMKGEEKEVADEVEQEDVLKALNGERFDIDMDDAVAWMESEPGKYSGENYDEEAVKAEIDQWPEGLSPDEYFAYILALTAEDFTKYQEFLDETEVVFNDISSRPDGEKSEADPEAQGTLNVQILLDASGSMAGQVDGETKMDLAKAAISDFVSNLPANAQVSLRVYGHKGSNERDGKEESCKNTEEVYTLGSYNEKKFEKALNQFDPTGYTPIAAAIEAAGEDLSKADGENVQSVVYVVSDGEETCGGDPVAAAEGLQKSDIAAVVNIIGFDIEASEREALESIAKAGAGEYFHADTAQELRDTLEKERTDLIEDWHKWESENVNVFFDQESDYVNQSNEYESEAINLSNTEEMRQKDLTRYMEDIMEDVDAVEIRNLIGSRAYNIREYVRDKYYAIREEARNKGYELREEVRDKGYEEREELRNKD